MTPLEIKAFLTVVRCGSLSAAAGQLFITQPALSRRLQALETDLGYPLLKRGKGLRTIELTEVGKAFVPIAKEYDALWREAKALPQRGKVLRLSSVGSVCTYLLPEVFSAFMEACPECRIAFQQHHSLEAYGYVARGEVELALISDEMFSREVRTVPFYREKMVLALSPGKKYGGLEHPAALEAGDEIRLPWNPEYDLWHNYWFPQAQPPRVLLDQMSLLEYFIRQEDLWAFIPASAGERLASTANVRIRELQDGPPDRLIYCLMKTPELSPPAGAFLKLMEARLQTIPGITVRSLWGSPFRTDREMAGCGST